MNEELTAKMNSIGYISSKQAQELIGAKGDNMESYLCKKNLKIKKIYVPLNGKHGFKSTYWNKTQIQNNLDLIQSYDVERHHHLLLTDNGWYPSATAVKKLLGLSITSDHGVGGQNIRRLKEMKVPFKMVSNKSIGKKGNGRLYLWNVKDFIMEDSVGHNALSKTSKELPEITKVSLLCERELQKQLNHIIKLEQRLAEIEDCLTCPQNKELFLCQRSATTLNHPAKTVAIPSPTSPAKQE